MWLYLEHRGRTLRNGWHTVVMVVLDPTRAVCGCATQFLHSEDSFTDGKRLSMTGYAVILQP